MKEEWKKEMKEGIQEVKEMLKEQFRRYIWEMRSGRDGKEADRGKGKEVEGREGENEKKNGGARGRTERNETKGGGEGDKGR